MATAKRKKLLLAAIILQLKRSRKRSEKWDEKNMVEDMDLLKRRILLDTTTVVSRRYIK